MAETIDIQIKTNAADVASSFEEVKEHLEELNETAEDYLNTVNELVDAESDLHEENLNVTHTTNSLDKLFTNLGKETEKMDLSLGKVVDDLGKFTGNQGLGRLAQILNSTSFGKIIGDTSLLNGSLKTVLGTLGKFVGKAGVLGLIAGAIAIIAKQIKKVREEERLEREERQRAAEAAAQDAANAAASARSQLTSIRERAGLLDSTEAIYQRMENAIAGLEDETSQYWGNEFLNDIRNWEQQLRSGQMTIEQVIDAYERLVTPQTLHLPFGDETMYIDPNVINLASEAMTNLAEKYGKNRKAADDLDDSLQELDKGFGDNTEAVNIIKQAIDDNRDKLEKLNIEYNNNKAIIEASTLSDETKEQGIKELTIAYENEKAAIEATIAKEKEEEEQSKKSAAQSELEQKIREIDLTQLGQYPTKIDLIKQGYDTWLYTSANASYTLADDISALTNIENLALSEDIRINNEKIKLLEEYGDAYGLSVEQLAELDALKRKNQMNDLKIMQNNAMKERQIQQLKLEGYASAAGSLSQIFDSMASVSEENTGLQKGFATASALMSTYQSAQLAYNSAFLPVPTQASPIIGALSMAAAIATGLANLHQIWAVKTDGSQTGSGAGSAVAATPQATVLNADSYANVLSDTTFADLQMNAAENQKVYVVSSEISESQNSNKTVVTTSTF